MIGCLKEIIIYSLLLFLIVGCNSKSSRIRNEKFQEDYNAKQMLQGIWRDEDENEVVFRAKGDTIFYPDTTSRPVYFQIISDTLVLHGSNVMKYPIVKQTAQLFEFKNQNGDIVRLIKSSNPDDILQFEHRSLVVLNQNTLIKRDTVVNYNNKRYHCYIQVNPTTYKVIKTAYNDEGVEVDNVYYDNIIHISIFQGKTRLYSKDLYKKDFTKDVPQQFLKQSVLSDISFIGIDRIGVHFTANLGIPDSYLSYVVEIIILLNGTMRMQVNK